MKFPLTVSQERVLKVISGTKEVLTGREVTEAVNSERGMPRLKASSVRHRIKDLRDIFHPDIILTVRCSKRNVRGYQDGLYLLTKQSLERPRGNFRERRRNLERFLDFEVSSSRKERRQS